MKKEDRKRVRENWRRKYGIFDRKELHKSLAMYFNSHLPSPELKEMLLEYIFNLLMLSNKQLKDDRQKYKSFIDQRGKPIEKRKTYKAYRLIAGLRKAQEIYLPNFKVYDSYLCEIANVNYKSFNKWKNKNIDKFLEWQDSFSDKVLKLYKDHFLNSFN